MVLGNYLTVLTGEFELQNTLSVSGAVIVNAGILDLLVKLLQVQRMLL